MSAAFAEVKRTTQSLSTTEKAALIDLLLPQVVAAAADPIPRATLEELERRAEEFDRNPAGYSIEEVEAKILSTL